MRHKTEQVLVELEDIDFLAYCYTHYELIAVSMNKALFEVRK